MNPLAELRLNNSFCSKCDICPASSSNNHIVTSEGLRSSLMIVGEAPGFQEDRAGSPFVGDSGKVLDKLLEAARIRRRHVFITNVIRCRPYVKTGSRTKNRPPKSKEIKNCASWLELELKLCNPIVVLALGATAARSFMPMPRKQFKMVDYIGKQYPILDRSTLIVCYHPSYLMQYGRSKFDDAAECFKLAKRIIQNAT